MSSSTISQEEPGLLEQAGEYAQTQINLLKYRAIDTGADIASSIVSKLIVVLLFIFFFVLINIGFALWIGHALGNSFYGFFIMGGFYGVLALIFTAFGGNWIKIPVNDKIVRKFFK